MVGIQGCKKKNTLIHEIETLIRLSCDGVYKFFFVENTHDGSGCMSNEFP